jgi:peptidoglycan/LPS O-acetylase OafA/YrhL
MVVSIQYLRGLAAVMVLLNHVMWKVQQRGGNTLDGFAIGEAGVDIFFVVSGFIMCHITADRPVPVGAFLAHRAIRILPLYWIVTTVALAIHLARPGLVNSSGGTTHVLASYLLLPVEGKFLVQAGWTLSYELFFYLVFAAALPAPHRGRWLVAAALVGLAGLAWLPVPHHLWAFLTRDLMIEFVFGMAVWALWRKQVVRSARTGALLVIAAVVLFAARNASPNGAFLSTVRAFHYGIPALLLCWGLVSLESWIARHRIAWLVALGDASYSLYLSHVFTVGAVALMLGLLRITGPWADTAAAIAMTLGAVVAGGLCYRWIEHPARVALRGRLADRDTAPAGLRSASPAG